MTGIGNVYSASFFTQWEDISVRLTAKLLGSGMIDKWDTLSDSDVLIAQISYDERTGI